MGKWVYFHLKAWHFAVAFITLMLLTNIIAYIELEKDISAENLLTDTDYSTAADDIKTATCFVLFYRENSKSSSIMEQNLYQTAKEKYNQAKYIKINIDKYPEVQDIYNLTGVPCTIIFKEGKEQNRITGIVSKSNLVLINKRMLK